MSINELQYTSSEDRYARRDVLSPAELLNEEISLTAVGLFLLAIGLLRRGASGALLAFAGGLLTAHGSKDQLAAQLAGSAPGGRRRRRPPVDGADEESLAMKPERTEAVDEASWESFPASDPPSWAGGTT